MNDFNIFRVGLPLLPKASLREGAGGLSSYNLEINNGVNIITRVIKKNTLLFVVECCSIQKDCMSIQKKCFAIRR